MQWRSHQDRFQSGAGVASVHLYCYAKQRRLGDWTNTPLFLTVAESGKPKIKAPTDLTSGEKWCPGSQKAIFSLCPLVAGEVKGALLGLYFRTRILVMGLHPHDLITSQSPTPKYHPLGFNLWILEPPKHSVSSSMFKDPGTEGIGRDENILPGLCLCIMMSSPPKRFQTTEPQQKQMSATMLSKLMACWNHLGSFKRYQCLGPAPSYLNLMFMGWGLGFSIFKKPSMWSNVQSTGHSYGDNEMETKPGMTAGQVQREKCIRNQADVLRGRYLIHPGQCPWEASKLCLVMNLSHEGLWISYQLVRSYRKNIKLLDFLEGLKAHWFI